MRIDEALALRHTCGGPDWFDGYYERGGPGVCHIQLMAEASRVATVSLWGNAAGPAWPCCTAAGVARGGMTMFQALLDAVLYN